jgi:hypothetical protein
MRAVKGNLSAPFLMIEESEVARWTRAVEDRPGYPMESWGEMVLVGVKVIDPELLGPRVSLQTPSRRTARWL